MPQKKRRQYTKEQKAEAVRIVQESGKPVVQVAQEMGLAESVLRQWVHKAKIDANPSPDGALTSTERQELNYLRRELKRTQMERDFLKKAAAFFAKDSSDLTS